MLPVEELNIFIEQLRSMARLGNPEVVRQELDDMRAEDLSQAIERMEVEESVTLMGMLDAELAGNILIELPTDSARKIINALPDITVAHYLDVLPMDDALDLREELGPDRFDDLLEIIPAQDAQEIRRLLGYPENSAGRVMTERFFEVKPGTTMTELLQDIRDASDEKYETVNDVYVISEDRHLLGLFSLRKALRAAPKITAKEIMRAEVVTCLATDPAERAARSMSRYGFYALPVLDQRGRMVGIFTGDDAVTVLRDADTEDVLKMGAVSGQAEAYLSLSVAALAKKRLPWLMALFLAESCTGFVLRHYSPKENPIPAALLFVPLLIGAGGNSGAQTTSMVTRALAVGEISTRDFRVVLNREFFTALIVGTVLGLIGYIRAIFWGTDATLCLAIGCALPCIVIWSTSVGGALPLFAKKLGIDPAVMCGPFISTFVDATGLIIYFEILRLFFNGGIGPR